MVAVAIDEHIGEEKSDKKTKREIESQIAELVASVIGLAEDAAKRREARDCPEFMAYEIIDLVEWRCDLSLQRFVASGVIDEMKLPIGTKNYVQKHFDLWLSSV
jgi:hypothetical protein